MDPFNAERLESADSQAAIRTYSYYSAAWCLRTGDDRPPRDEQAKLTAFSQLHKSSSYDVEAVRQPLLRGYLTLKLIQDIPVNEKPDFAMTNALWLPVQTYYAVHGFGMAFLAAKNGSHNLPGSHGTFMRVAAESIVRRLFPAPFSAMLQQGYRGFQYLQPELINIHDDRMNIGSGHNLERPHRMTRDAHIAQCLHTTRRRRIEARLEDERKHVRKAGKKHGVLRRQRQIEIASTVEPTTVFDYLYRTRLKSNYEDPTMYQIGSDHSEAVLEFVRNTQELATTLCALLAAILWETIDPPAKDKLTKEVDIDRLLESIDR